MSARQLGDLTIGRILEQVTPFDPFTFFPDSTPEDWEPHKHWLQPDGMDPSSGDLLFPMQSYVVRTAHHTILIDGCIGNHKPRPTRPNWHLKDDDQWMKALKSHNLSVEDIDFVMCTHLHSDHVGWNTKLVDGRWVPTFPNARYVFSKTETDAWATGDSRFASEPYQDSVLPIIAAGRADLVAEDFALDDQVWLEPSPGHTPGHVSVRLSSAGENAVMSGDLMHSPIQCMFPDWQPWPDWDPQVACQTRRSFLERYSETDTLVCTAHFPLPSAGRVVAQGDAFRFVAEDAQW